MSTIQTADVVIVGAGIIGLNIAWQLRRRSSLRILVLEKGPGVGEGSSGASSAVCRHRYTRDAMVRLSCDGIHAYRHWQDYTGLANPRASFRNDQVLWMPCDDGQWAVTEQARMTKFGVRSEVLDDQELGRRFSALSANRRGPDFEYGTRGESEGGSKHLLELDGGYMDPVDCLQDLAEACGATGVDLRFNSPVEALLGTTQRVTGVRLASGDEVSSGCVVNAAGPWFSPLLESLGLPLPWATKPVRIQMVHLDCPAHLHGKIPVTLDMAGGIYFRQQNRGQQLVLGSVREEDEREAVSDPDDYLRVADDDFIHRQVHALMHRIPELTITGPVRSYTGLYTVNLDDVHPLVGPSGIAGLLLANAFSGHGFKLAPAIGALVARQLVGPSSMYDTEVAEDFLAVDRAPLATDDLSVLA